MTTELLPRSSGILLHPSCLPGPFGIGDLGPMAYRWVETLAAMKQTWWQILPLGPAGESGSPYQSFSAFASDIKLLSPELLEREGLVSNSLWAGKQFREERVDFGQVYSFKTALLRTAWESFQSGKAAHLKNDFESYTKREDGWLNDYALFRAIRESLGGLGLSEWPKNLLLREPAAMAAAGQKLADVIGLCKFGQFLFDRQWEALRKFAADRNVKIIGDASIFVAQDSADIWAHAEQFLLDADRKPVVVAGVPPDYFSEDGQHWGNPIYDWKRMAETGYAWWCARLARLLKQVDLIRLDHFRGFRASTDCAGRLATDRGRSGVDHSRRDCLEGPAWFTRDAGIAVCPGRSDKPALAPQLRYQLLLLHGNTRQRDHQWLVWRLAGEGSALPVPDDRA
jgi:4-alpha-glucanotransferase